MVGQRIGYIRVSTLEQNTVRQFDGVQLDRLFTDKASRKDVKRPQVGELLGFIRDGDTLVVHSMDRLARNLDDLRALVQQLTARGVRVEFLKENLTFTGEDSPLAQLMLSVMGAFAEFERSLVSRRLPWLVSLGSAGRLCISISGRHRPRFALSRGSGHVEALRDCLRVLFHC